ncbi:MAG: hypothetical protein SVW02_01655 [Candidatus Nanohaloarchaea archaeon]|nr:hypothetical protein [Candidatus Nanohaloarchaea archaeon]
MGDEDPSKNDFSNLIGADIDVKWDAIMNEVTLEVVDTLLDNPTIPFTKSQLAEASDVPQDALIRHWLTLKLSRIIQRADVDEEGTYWRLNPDAEVVEALARIIHA